MPQSVTAKIDTLKEIREEIRKLGRSKQGTMNAVEKLKLLSSQFSQIKMSEPVNQKKLYGYVGGIIGNFDKEYTELLKVTNGFSAIDYGFYGVKKTSHDTGLKESVVSLWPNYEQLGLYFYLISGSSSKDYFGYLDIFKTHNSIYPIGYFNPNLSPQVFLVGSSFNKFLFTFLDDVKGEIETTGDICQVTKEHWPLDLSHWIKNDPKIVDIVKSDAYKSKTFLYQYDKD